MTDLDLTIAIVGCGPRGLSIVERLTAYAESGRFCGTLHIIDPEEPGSGRVWRSAQPQSLIMNTLAADACLYADSSVRCEGPTPGGPSLYDWARAQAGHMPDDTLRDEAERLTPITSPSRRLYGAYLRAVFAACRDRLFRAGVKVIVHNAWALDIAAAEGSEWVTLSTGAVLRVDEVVLALGHVQNDLHEEERAFAEAAAVGGWTYSGPGDAAEQSADALTAEDRVIVRGMGLNFFDTVSLLTEGRGGRFERDDTGRMRYLSSGDEPSILATSRRGVPFCAKPDLSKGRIRVARHYPTNAELAQLVARRGELDFFVDIWPHIHKNSARHFLEVALGREAHALVRALDALDVADAEAINEHVRSATGVGYDARREGDPLRGRTFDSADDLQHAVQAYVDADLAEAMRGAASALKAAHHAVGASREWVFPLVDGGGVRGASYRRDVLGWYLSHANSLAGGPPMFRLEQLRALAERGVVRFLGSATVTSDGERAVASLTTVRGRPRIEATTLVEARIQNGSIRRVRNSAIESLLARGRAREFMIAEPSGQPIGSGGFDVDIESLNVIDASGDAQPHLFAVGVPVGSHVGRSLSPVHGTDSPFFRETDHVVASIVNNRVRLHGVQEEASAC